MWYACVCMHAYICTGTQAARCSCEDLRLVSEIIPDHFSTFFIEAESPNQRAYQYCRSFLSAHSKESGSSYPFNIYEGSEPLCSEYLNTNPS